MSINFKCRHKVKSTYSAASACWTRTCCLAGLIGETWCSHHCDILSSPLLWLCVVSERQNKAVWLKLKTTAGMFVSISAQKQYRRLFNHSYIDLHFPVESIVQEQVVSHPDTVWFHRMSLSVVIVPYVTCKNKDITC